VGEQPILVVITGELWAPDSLDHRFIAQDGYVIVALSNG
jgi:hypothetical protein